MTFRKKLQQRAKKNKATKVLGRFSPYQVILAPLMTEKSHKEQEQGNKYTFKVHKDANKNDVKQAISYLYNVDPVKINITNTKNKYRQKRGLVKKKFKKAIITLAPKQKIEIGT